MKGVGCERPGLLGVARAGVKKQDLNVLLFGREKERIFPQDSLWSRYALKINSYFSSEKKMTAGGRGDDDACDTTEEEKKFFIQKVRRQRRRAGR